MFSKKFLKEIPMSAGEWEDLMGNSGSVLMQVTRCSDRSDALHPEYEQEVKVRYTARMLQKSQLEETLATTSSNAHNQFQLSGVELPAVEVVTRVGYGDIPVGLELAIRSMKESSTCLVRCDPRFAFGSKGFQGFPPDSWVEFELSLLELRSKKKDADEMTFAELREEAMKRKVRGNECYRSSDLDKAVKCYRTAAVFGESGLSREGLLEADEGEFRNLLRDVFNNLAVVLLKQGKVAEAKEACIGALNADPKSTKAIVQACEISISESNFEEAKACLAKLDKERDFKSSSDSTVWIKKIHSLKSAMEEKKRRNLREEKRLFGGKLDQISLEDTTDNRSKLRKQQAAHAAALSGPGPNNAEDTTEDRNAASAGNASDRSPLLTPSKQLASEEVKEFARMDKKGFAFAIGGSLVALCVAFLVYSMGKNSYV